MANARRVALNNPRQEALIFRSRALVISILVTLVFLLLLLRLYDLQITHNEHYQTLSNDNRVRVLAIPPTRGLIYDRTGHLLADNRPSYELVITPSNIEVDEIDTLLHEITSIISLEEYEIRRFKRTLRRKQSFQKIPLTYNLTDAEVAKFAVAQYHFPGVEIIARSTRRYPEGEHFAHVMGYVGRINETELVRIDKRDYEGTSHIGKLGIEKKYEDILHGQVGYDHVEINAQGRSLRVLKTQPSEDGMDLQLSLLNPLQQLAQELLKDKKGAIVALDPNNGDVLAFASQPTYDPNLFVNGISQKAYSALRDDPARPLFNRALVGQYPPGSTVKPLVALAALETDVTQPDKTIFAGPYFKLPGSSRRYRDWKKEGHGLVDMDKAIAQSCDVYFYQIGHQMGIDTMHDFLAQFGLGRMTNIDTVGEVGGLLPSRSWKVNMRREPWYPGETVITSIGQGYMLTTPLQLAVMTSYLANQGKAFQPRLVTATRHKDKTEFQPTEPTPLPDININSPAYWQAITAAMINVVHSSYGTARAISKQMAYTMAGKTGTAQVFTIAQDEEYDEEEVAQELHDHALFVAFAPAEDAQIALAIVVENGGSGSTTAAPIARQLIDAYLLDPVHKETNIASH